MLEAKRRPVDRVTLVERTGDALQIQTERGFLRVEPQREDVFRIRYSYGPLGNRLGDGIIAHTGYAGWSCEETRDEIVLSTSRAKLHISKNNAAIRYEDASGKLLLAERGRALERFDAPQLVSDGEAEMVWEDVETPDGTKRVLKRKQPGQTQTLYHMWLHLAFQENERLYGLGQAEEGILNLRGTTQYLHQANRKIAIPMLLSSRQWGILWATASPAIFQDTQYGTYFFTEADEEMDYYFIADGSFDGIIGAYRYLTGKASMLPRWTMGYIQSQERYETQEELLDIAEEYCCRKIGLDGIVLDWCSWRPGQWGQKTFDPERFGQIDATINRLHEKNIHFMLSIWPNMTEGCDDYKEFAEKQLLLPNSDIYDAYRPEARNLYWAQANRSLFSKGVDAWWCDSSEPFAPEWTHLEKPDPSTMYHEYVDTVTQHMPLQRGNSYALYHAQSIYEGQRATGSTKRVVNLTRSAHTGQQRYGTILWSGDIEASWDVYRRQITAGLNFCASGLPYWTLDIGGFFVKQGGQWFWNGDYEDGPGDPGYCELFVRWYQLGAFLPIFRGHGTDFRRELWAFDGPDHRFYHALLAANRLRYRLTPYLYSLAGNVWRKDGTIMRMLAFDFPEDEKALDITDQFMLGPCLMVCPVTRPMSGSTAKQSVYLPAGTSWYDWHTGEKHHGGQTLSVDAPLDQIPLFVREGSILPLADGLESTADLRMEKIELHIYTGADGCFELYHDAGDGYDYEQGDYGIACLTWNEKSQKLEINCTNGKTRWFAPDWQPAIRLIR